MCTLFYRNILKENGMNIRLKNGSWCLVQTEYVCDSSDNSIEENDFCNEVNKDLNFDQDVFTESWDTDEDHL